jgi:hypothetical protein
MMENSVEFQMGVLNILDTSGHRQLYWDMSNAKEIAAAQKTFDRLVKHGYSAFGSVKSSDPKQAVTAFDSTMEEVVMVPRIVGG